MSVQDCIAEMTRRIEREYHPQKIILLGSHARGDAAPDSDVDLLVVMEVTGSRQGKAIEIGASLHDIPLAKDIMVTTPSDFAWRQNISGTIEYPAAREGKVLYARG